MRLEAADRPAAAVEVDEHRELALRRRPVDAHRDRPRGPRHLEVLHHRDLRARALARPPEVPLPQAPAAADVVRSTNTSGYAGVVLRKAGSRRYWTAQTAQGGEWVSRSFSIARYGEEVALLLALMERQAQREEVDRARDGRDARPAFPVGPFYVKGCRLVGFAMFNATPDEQRAAAEDINRWLAAGKIRSRIDRIMPLDQAAVAHRLQEENTVGKAGTLSGKIVIKP